MNILINLINMNASINEINKYIEKKDKTKILLDATIYGDLNIIKYLINIIKINPFSCNNNNVNCLHIAAHNGYLECVKYFVETIKLDPSIKDVNGKTSIHYECGYYNNELNNISKIKNNNISEIIRENKKKKDNNLEIVKYFIEIIKIDPTIKDNNGNTPIYDAAYHDNIEIVKYLVNNNNLSISTKNNNGETILHFYLQGLSPYLCILKTFTKMKIIKYLIEICRIDPHVRDNIGNTILHNASYYGMLDVIKYLIQLK